MHLVRVASRCWVLPRQPRAIIILREAGHIHLESTPKGLDLDDVRAHLLAVPHVQDVHDLHASTIATGLPVLTAHVVLDEELLHQRPRRPDARPPPGPASPTTSRAVSSTRPSSSSHRATPNASTSPTPEGRATCPDVLQSR